MSPECVDVDEAAEHVFFVCPRFTGARNSMMAASGQGTTSDNFVQRVCPPKQFEQKMRGTGHKSRECTKPPKCLSYGKPDDKHVTGGPQCPAYKRGTTK